MVKAVVLSNRGKVLYIHCRIHYGRLSVKLQKIDIFNHVAYSETNCANVSKGHLIYIKVRYIFSKQVYE